ncbi:MAG: hypothetical protein KDE46_30355 [Caldilineaceae bacterium]|nr:hypothetical protein [Caldilineaceae bacterium]
MSTNQTNTAGTAHQSSKNVTSVEDCATILVGLIQQLRQDNGVPENEEVSLYVTDVPIVHSTLSEYEDEIIKKANLVDVVQVNMKAGNPMPETLPHVERQIGNDTVTIAIERQAA